MQASFIAVLHSVRVQSTGKSQGKPVPQMHSSLLHACVSTVASAADSSEEPESEKKED